MAWGAINELTTLTNHKRLARVANHPVLSELLARIVRDESRHFGFYFRQAAHRLAVPRTARIAGWLIERFWAPVGSGVQPASETRFLAAYLFADAAGREAARSVDRTIRTLPGFAGLPLLEAWMAREVGPAFAPRETGAIDAAHGKVDGRAAAHRPLRTPTTPSGRT